MDTSHSVLDFPELLSAIFSVLGKKSQARCALVCKAWSPIALDCLWSTMDSVIPLLLLLSPLKKNSEYLEAKNNDVDCLTFLTYPYEQQWIRFQSYAARVKALTINSKLSMQDTAIYLSPSLFAQIAMRRRTPFAVPNLTRLTIDASSDITLLSHSVIFFGNLLYLDVSFDFVHVSARYARIFFEDLAALSPAVRELTIRRRLSGERSVAGIYLSSIMNGIRTALKDSLSHLLSLSRLTLPAALTSADVIASVSRLPFLHSIVLSYQSNGENGFTYLPQFFENRFNNLKEISLPVTKDARGDLFRNSGMFGRLTSISIYCDDNIQRVTMEGFISGLARSCANVESLALFSKEGYWLSIAPLFAIPSLRRLRVWPCCANPMTDTDLETALSHHDSSLEILYLPWLCNPNGPRFTLRALQILAKRCSKLRSLSLCVNLEQIPAAPEVLVWPDDSFKCLERLNFGSSGITDFKIAAIAVFLFKVLYPADRLPRIEATNDVSDAFERNYEEIGVSKNLDSFTCRWLEVTRALKALKEDVGAKVRRLEKELAEARAWSARVENGDDGK